MQGDPVRLANAVQIAKASAAGLIVVVVLAAIAGKAAWPSGYLRIVAAAVAIVGAGIAIGTQNHLALENPLIPAAGIVAALAGRRLAGRSLQTAARASGAPAALGIAVALMLLPVAQDSPCRRLDPDRAGRGNAGLDRRDAIGRAAAEPTRARPRPTTGNLVDDDRFYLDILGDAVSLVGRHVPPDARLLPLTWNNPFPTLTGRAPVRHELLWWHAGRTFLASAAPDPRRLLAGVDAVLIPTIYYNFDTTVAMQAIYGPELDRSFVPTETTQYWTLLMRR